MKSPVSIHKPIFVVGAPRSGKKMTSDVLNQSHDTHSFPYELTFTWRSGHGSCPLDSLTPDQLTPAIREKLHSVFRRAALKSQKSRLIDRTDHNVVRMEYVHAVFPDAKFIHIIRDGRASVASAILRRHENVPLSYYLGKMAAVSPSDLLIQGGRYGWDIFQSKLGKKRFRKLWGIRTPMISVGEENPSLEIKCAMQWKDCVGRGLESHTSLPAGQSMVISYEDSVQNPVEVFKRVYDFAELDWDSDIERWVLESVRTGSLNSWKKKLSKQQLLEIEPIMSKLLDELGYDDRP